VDFGRFSIDDAFEGLSLILALSCDQSIWRILLQASRQLTLPVLCELVGSLAGIARADPARRAKSTLALTRIITR
jgi:hypothetical protein